MPLLFAEDVSTAELWRTLLGLIVLPALIVMNGLFVAIEFALVAVRKTRVEEMVRHRISGALAVQTALSNLTRSIAAAQLGITLCSIGLGWFAEQALAQVFDWLFAPLPVPWGTVAKHSVATVIAFVLLTFCDVVFGEMLPKSVALQRPDRLAVYLARPLNIFAAVTRPLIALIDVTTTSLLRLFGLKRSLEGMVHTVEELELLIEDTEEAGILDPQQAELVQNVFRLSNKHIRDCMVPRDKMAALELTTPSDKVLEAVRSGAHTRMPVYAGDLDNIVGIVNTKNLFYLFSLQGVVVLEDAIYPALFLKPDESVGNALRLFKNAKRPMALVRGDDGEILGLVTLEDLLEEIIGDIEDEHDQPIAKVPRARLRKLAQQ